MSPGRAAVCVVALLATLAASPAERAYERGVAHVSAAAVTADLRGATGERVAFVCSVISIVDRATFIGQCGKAMEPVDLYVIAPTPGLRAGQRMRVLGEMAPPSVWVDIRGHSWYTGFVKARFIDRL